MANFKVGAAQDLPLNEDKAWDGAAAKASIFAWAGFDGDSPSPEKARKGFLVYDADEPNLKGSYKLPFAQVMGDTLTALASGVRAAASRLPQTDGLSSATETSARAIITHYEGKSSASRATRINLTDEEDETLSSGVQYSRVAELCRAAAVTDVSSLIDQIAAQSPLFDRDMYSSSDNPPFTWNTKASNTRLDTYFTHMMPSSLKNYAMDANDGGVPFMHAHDPHSMPIGRSLQGTYTGGSDPNTAIDWWSVPGIRSKDITSDDFYRGMNAGIFRDVSVGFYGGSYICDLCGRDLMTYECSHFPGLQYPKDEGNGSGRAAKKSEMVTATAGVDDAHLAEVSTVYHGSCPGAVIIKARGLAKVGELRPELARMLEAQYRIALPTLSRFAITQGRATEPSVEAVADEEDIEPIIGNDSRDVETEDTEMPDKTEEKGSKEVAATPTVERVIEVREVEKIVEVVKSERAMELVAEAERATLTDLGVEEDASAQRAISVLMTQVRELKPLAEDGKAYRDHCIDEGVTAVTRAYGADADVERYRGVLSKESIETIRQMTEDWNKMADNTLKGGRQTVDTVEPTKIDGKRSSVPDRLRAV